MANKTASTFLGYIIEKLESMNISDINAITPEEMEKETKAATDQQSGYHILKYRLSNGDIRVVEVYCYAVLYEGKNVLFSIVHYITKNINLVEETIKKDTIIIAIGSVSIIILLLIQKAFERYYKTTVLSRETDANKLNDLIDTMEPMQVYTQQQIDIFVGLYLNNAKRDKLDPIIDVCAENYEALDLEERCGYDEFL